MPSYVVKSGDCFHTIAGETGFSSGQQLYNHPSNADLKAKRPNANILMPGDRVVVPEKRTRSVAVPTGAVHLFHVTLPKRTLRVRVVDATGQPIIDEPYTLEIGDRSVSARTDADGTIAQPVPGGARVGALAIMGRSVTLDFGALDPMKDVFDQGASGARERLRNLGYDVRERTEETDELDRGTRTALALFQHNAALEVTGELDDATANKLTELHGC